MDDSPNATFPSAPASIQNLDVTEFVRRDETVARVKHILILIPGIRTEGAWSNVIHQEMRKSGYDCEICPVPYKRYSSISFLFGIGLRARVEQVRAEVTQNLKQYNQAIIDIFCHSNGTKFLSHIADVLPANRVRLIIFSGSICTREDGRSLEQRTAMFVNFCGVRDLWPTLAEVLRPKIFERTGVVGFRANRILDRFFDFGHSTALNVQHVKEQIIPLITRMESPGGEYLKPKWFNSVSLLRRTLILIIISTVLGFGLLLY